MRGMVALLWFLTAFVLGAGVFAATRHRPVLHAVVVELNGGNLFTRCRQAGACNKPAPAPRQPVPQLPADMDRA
jgi:hypothetical protein